MSQHEEEHFKKLGRTEAVAQAHRGLREILLSGQWLMSGDNRVYVPAEAVIAMLGRCAP